MAKEQQQFLKAYDEYAAPILRHIYFRVSDKETAEDLSQDTFFKAWRYISEGKGDEIRSFKSFLYKIANNLVIDYYRQKYKKTVSIDDISPEDISQEADQEQLTEISINVKIVEKHLNELKSEYKEIIIYRYIDDLTIREISEVTGRSKNHISVIIHRAVNILKEKINYV